MKKFIWLIICIFTCIQLAGCTGWVVRTSSTKKPRVDQEISGNRGFIFGKPSTAPKEPAFTERKVYEIEIEMPDLPKKKESVEKKPEVRKPKEDKAIWGNKGFIIGGPLSEERVLERTKEEIEEAKPSEEAEEKISQISEPKEKKEIVTQTYKVKKGDTLQKISRKFYGTTKKWMLVYKANKDKLKSPDSIYPGQVLIIPEVKEYKK